MKIQLLLKVATLTLVQQMFVAGKEESMSTVLQGVPAGTFIEFVRGSDNLDLRIQSKERHMEVLWHCDFKKSQSIIPMYLDYNVYPDMRLMSASHQEGILVVVFKIDFPQTSPWWTLHKDARYRYFMKTYQKSKDGDWKIKFSVYIGSIWWDVHNEEIAGVSIVSPGEYEVIFKKGWKLSSGISSPESFGEISVFDDTPKNIEWSNRDMIYKITVADPTRRRFFYDAKKANLFLLDPNQKKVCSPSAVWWPSFNELVYDAHADHGWTRELERQKKMRKENQVRELQDLYVK